MDWLTERLNDERCGLFILAGLDRSENGGGTLTIHAAEGALSPENRDFIASSVSAGDPGMDLRFRLHSSGDLHAPDSLEGFAGLFGHDRIVTDPTGAFARVSKLLSLARLIRTDLEVPVRSILWQPHASALVVVTNSPEGASTDRLTETLRSLVDTLGCADLQKTIRSVSVDTAMPAGRYTPVDAASRPARERKSRLAGLLARASGIAALIGLGTMTAAQAAAPTADIEDSALMPGIIALVDLTTLGETAHGMRNHFQAVGGLRLYFGASGMLKASAFRPGGAADEVFRMPEGTVEPDEAEPDWPLPTRVAYG